MISKLIIYIDDKKLSMIDISYDGKYLNITH